MPHIHTEEEIKTHLFESSVGTLGTLDENGTTIRQRLMYYGIDDAWNLYLMSTKESPKVDQILRTPEVSFFVFENEDPYDLTWEIEIEGKAEVLESSKQAKVAIKKLKDRNPFAAVAIESGITGHFTYIKISPTLIRFRVYGEALQGEEPTIVNF